jgi:hypothetical protein
VDSTVANRVRYAVAEQLPQKRIVALTELFLALTSLFPPFHCSESQPATLVGFI